MIVFSVGTLVSELFEAEFRLGVGDRLRSLLRIVGESTIKLDERDFRVENCSICRGVMVGDVTDVFFPINVWGPPPSPLSSEMIMLVGSDLPDFVTSIVVAPKQ